MADLPESNEWTTGIYQLETSDPVLGGPEGIDNLQAKQLANRTRWLKDKTESLGVSLAGKAGKATTLGGYDITDAFTKPEATSAIQQAIASLVASSPAALNTLKELADALGNDPNFATTMTNALAGKAGKATTLGGYGITDAFTKPEATSAIQQAIASLVASSPAALDTLKELADALGNDPNFATTMTNALAGKASKASTLAGYGINDAYSKSGTYSRGEIDAALAPLSQATEVTQGTAKIASFAQMTTGDDSVIVPPKKLRWGFSITLAQNGGIAFPFWLGGLVIQWGLLVATGGTAPFGNLAFPMAFPNAAFALFGSAGATNINAGLNVSGSGGIPIVAFDLLSNSGARWRFDSNNGTGMTAGIPVRWLAVGY